jgi:hypothetical protein
MKRQGHNSKPCSNMQRQSRSCRYVPRLKAREGLEIPDAALGLDLCVVVVKRHAGVVSVAAAIAIFIIST